jgi:hypothetical protein
MSEANVNPYNSGDATRQAHRQHQKQKVNSTNEHANALSISTGRTVHARSNVLRMLMRICSRGHAWRDAAEIPVLEILAKWKASVNHYASDQMFKKVALEEVSHIHWLPFNILVRTNR